MRSGMTVDDSERDTKVETMEWFSQEIGLADGVLAVDGEVE